MGMLHTNSVEDASEDKILAIEYAKTDFLAAIFPDTVCNNTGVDGFTWSLKETSKSVGASSGTGHSIDLAKVFCTAGIAPDR